MNPRICERVRRLEAYVPGEQPTGAGIIKLNTNENPYPPSPRVAEALAGFDAEALRRYPDPMSTGVRAALGRAYGFDPECIFAGNGSDEVLALCTRVFVGEGGTVGYFTPSYSLYPVLADIAGLAHRPLALDDGFQWAMPEDYACDVFFLPNPNAPTGMLFPMDRIEAFCRRTSGVVVIDEAYADFSAWNCLDLAKRFDNVIVCRTMSKSFSLAGLRFGYAFGAPGLIEALYKVKDSYNLDALAQRLATAAVEDIGWMQANVARIRATRERVAADLRRSGFTVHPSESNFLWVRPPGVPARELFEALREQRIFVRHFRGPRTEDFLRITVATDAEMDALIRAIGGILDRRSTR